MEQTGHARKNCCWSCKGLSSCYKLALLQAGAATSWGCYKLAPVSRPCASGIKAVESAGLLAAWSTAWLPESTEWVILHGQQEAALAVIFQRREGGTVHARTADHASHNAGHEAGHEAVNVLACPPPPSISSLRP